MSIAQHSPEETARLGEAIYAARIREKVEPAHTGEFLVMDVESGQYEIGPDDLTATKRMLAHRPDAVLYGLRTGSPAAYRLGGRFVVSPS